MEKKFKSIILLVCVLILLVPTCAFGADDGSGLALDVNDDCVYFGSYPQTEVVYKAEASGVYGKTWSTSGDYIVNEALYSRLMSADWDNSGDATVDGNKYHRIKKSDATYSISSDWYYSWSDSTTYHYFKYEPIKWRVLEKDGNDLFLLSDIVLDDQRYNGSSRTVTWETCTLRSWLNSTFLNRAFTADEQDAIKTTTVENRNNMIYGTDGGNDTQDKVYLLSESEVYTDNAVKYGFDSSYDEEDKARQSRSSTYAKAMGVCSDTDSSYLGNCWWWLRSPGYYSTYAACVHSYGVVDGDGFNVDNVDNGIHPALHLDLKSSGKDEPGGEIQWECDELYVYTGNPIEPVKIYTEGYTVRYENNVKAGRALFDIVDENGDVCDLGSFEIVPMNASVKSVKAGKRNITVTMVRKPKDYGGEYFKVAYRTGSSTWKYKITKSKTVKISGLKKGKKYTVKVKAGSSDAVPACFSRKWSGTRTSGKVR